MTADDRDDQTRLLPTWARCLAYGLTALAVAAGWLFLGLLFTIGAALGEYDGTPAPPEWLFWVVLAGPVPGCIALLVSGICAGLGRGRAAWWALSVAAGCLAAWAPLTLLLNSNWA